jgi:hypothetical protein
MQAPIPETKLCTGPSHRSPVFLPATEDYWHFHKSGPYEGKPLSRCKDCQGWTRRTHPEEGMGFIPAEGLVPIIQELVSRCDSIKAAAECAGVARNTLHNILGGRQISIQKRKARAIILALHERRKLDRKNGGTSVRFRTEISASAVRQDRIEKRREEEQAKQEERLLDLTGY